MDEIVGTTANKASEKLYVKNNDKLKIAGVK
jgi:hypothetical protein